MAKAWQEFGIEPATPPVVSDADFPTAARRDWRKGMSDNIAYALLVYTGLQIFVTMSTLRAEGSSLLPYLALVILVVAIIPSCRRFERRWNRLDDVQAADMGMIHYYRRDRMVLWLLAIGLPFAITAIFRLMAALFS